jgi:hypothetical protein
MKSKSLIFALILFNACTGNVLKEGSDMKELNSYLIDLNSRPFQFKDWTIEEIIPDGNNLKGRFSFSKESYELVLDYSVNSESGKFKYVLSKRPKTEYKKALDDL